MKNTIKFLCLFVLITSYAKAGTETQFLKAVINKVFTNDNGTVRQATINRINAHILALHTGTLDNIAERIEERTYYSLLDSHVFPNAQSFRNLVMNFVQGAGHLTANFGSGNTIIVPLKIGQHLGHIFTEESYNFARHGNDIGFGQPATTLSLVIELEEIEGPDNTYEAAFESHIDRSSLFRQFISRRQHNDFPPNADWWRPRLKTAFLTS